jgi:hypothetical protein
VHLLHVLTAAYGTKRTYDDGGGDVRYWGEAVMSCLNGRLFAFHNLSFCESEVRTIWTR